MNEILVVEDDPNVLNMITRFLKKANMKLATAVDGKTACDIIDDDSDIKLVITDIVIPNGTGLSVIRKVKAIESGAKIIAISGGARTSAQDYLLSAEELGANITMRKPFKVMDLLNNVRELMAA